MRINKNVSKRMLAVLVALMMCLSMLPGTAFAADGGCNGHHNFVLKQDAYNGTWLECTNCGARCGQVDSNGNHKLDNVTKEPTCTESGTKEGSCDTCGKLVEIIPATGHAYEVTAYKAPTYTEAGERTYTCKNDPSHTYTETIPMLVCNHTEGNHEDVSQHKDPTCTDKGQIVYVCDTCGGVVDNKAPDALGHDWKAGEVIKEATCITEGEVKYDCSRCNASKDEVLPVDPANHVYDASNPATYKYIVDNEPTCEVKGNYHIECLCGAVIASGEIDPLGHDLETFMEGQTCETPGFIDVKCAREGCDYQTHVEAAAYGHDYGETAARVEISGNDEQHTVICKNNADHTSLENHAYGDWTWSEWEVNEDGTARTRTGSHTCDDCGHVQTSTETEAITAPPTGGDEPTVTPPTGGDEPTVTPPTGGTTAPVVPTPGPTVTPPETNIDDTDTPLTSGTETVDDAQGEDQQPDETEIPDAETPLTDDPEVEIPDAETPLDAAPETDVADAETPLTGSPETDVADEETPLAAGPDMGGTDIADTEVPMSDVPVTGDGSSAQFWALSALLSLTGLLWLALDGKKRQPAGK